MNNNGVQLGGRRGRRLAALGLLLALVLAACDTGKVDFSYSGAVAPTGQKPQSKLWVADGIWWGSLFDATSGDYHIFRYSWDTDSWTDTGVLVDERAAASMDVLWDGTHLYVVTAGKNEANGAQSPRIVRYTYFSGPKTWGIDPGYPVTIGTGGAESVVIAKDSTGLLWVTYTQGAKVWLTHSTLGDDAAWTPKYQLPTPSGESNVDPDDISAIVSYDGNKVGVLWSNQLTQIMYFASHTDGTADNLWTTTAAYSQPEGADDHIALRSVVGDPSGRVFAAAKTSKNGSSDPLINLLVLHPNGTWTSSVFGTVADQHTRAIVMLDTEHREVYLFASAPCCVGGKIYYKKASMDSPTFAPGLGTVFIGSDTHQNLNNPTSTKQNVTSATGLIVMAGDDRTFTYMHNRLALG